MFRTHAMMTVLAATLLCLRMAEAVELPDWVDNVRVQEPALGERGNVTLSGVWNDGCAPDSLTVRDVAGDIYLEVMRPGIGIVCLEAETPWTLSAPYQATNVTYTIQGSLFAVDPASPNVRRRESGPDALAQMGPGGRAVFHDLGRFSSTHSRLAMDVSRNGEVVVGAKRLKPGVDRPLASTGFIWSAATGERSLGILPGGVPGGSTAYGVSADGQVAVGGSAASGFGLSFRWDEVNQMTALPALTEVSESTAMAASHDSQYIVGMDQAFTPGAFGTDSRRAYRWSDATGTVDLGVVHQRGGSAATDVSSSGAIVVGDAFPPRYDESGEMIPLADIAEPFVWTEVAQMVGLGHMPYFIEIDVAFDYFRETRANAVSANGNAVVGFSSIIPDSYDLSGHIRTKAFRWTEEDGMVDLGHITGGVGLVETKAVDASEDAAVIVGMNHYELPPGMERPPDWRSRDPFIWNEHDGMRLLRDVVDEQLGLGSTGDLDGWLLDTVSAISDDGRTIVGTGINPQGEREAWRLVTNHNYDAGDANLDGVFNSRDLVFVFAAGEYEDRADTNSSWATGDWSGDNEFDSSDLVSGFQSGYERPTPGATVPEPASSFCHGLFLIGLWLRRSACRASRGPFCRRDVF